MRERTNVFAGIALERNSELRGDAEWVRARLEATGARFLLLDGDSRTLVRTGADELRLLDADECRRFASSEPSTYLGDDAGGPIFLARIAAASAPDAAAALGATSIDLRTAGQRLPAFQAGLFAYARAIGHWQSRTRYCGVCGSAVELVSFGHRGKCTNPACATEHFPRVDPAMIVIVTWEDRCLLGRQASWSERRYSTLAGFVEPGESVEDAVRREVLEEAGVRVATCCYHSSQPWPFPSSLMLGFTAEAADPTIRIGSELGDARWFSADDLVEDVTAGRIVLPPRVSVSHELIADWLRGQAGIELAELSQRETF